MESNSVLRTNKITLKVLINYIQFFLIIQSYEISVPIYMSDYLLISSIMSQVGRFWFSMECILKYLWNSYSVNVEILLVQSICLTTGLQVYLFTRIPFVKKKLSPFGVAHLKFYNVFLNCMFVLLPSLIDAVYSYMICEEIEGSFYLKKSPRDECYTDSYFLWLFLFYTPFLFIYVCLLPIKFLLNHKNSSKIIVPFIKYGKLTQISRLEKKGENSFTIGSLNDREIRSDLFNFLTKLALITVNQSDINALIKQLIIMWIFFFSILLIDPLLRPLRSKTLHLLDFFTKVSCVTINYLLLWLTRYTHNERSYASVFALMLIAQSLFFISVILVLFKNRLSHFKFLADHFYIWID